MKIGKTPGAKISGAKTSTATTSAVKRSGHWLERPAVDMGLRIGTAALMTAAAAIVLIHLIVLSGGLMSPDQNRVQQSAACFLRGC